MGNLQTCRVQVLGLPCKVCFLFRFVLFSALRHHQGNPLRSTFCGYWKDELPLPSCQSEKLGLNSPSSRQRAPCLDWNSLPHISYLPPFVSHFSCFSKFLLFFPKEQRLWKAEVFLPRVSIILQDSAGPETWIPRCSP